MAFPKRIIDCHNHIGAELLFYHHGNHPYGQDLPSMIENRGAGPITDWVVFPFVTNRCFETDAMMQGDLKVRKNPPVPYSYENRRLLQEVYDYFPEHAERVIPFVMLDPSRQTRAQAKALRELRTEYRFYGFKIQASILQSPIRSLLEEGRSLLELALEWNMPFIIHSSIDKNDPWSQCEDILDIAQANPEIHFCLAHSCRFDLPSLERLASLPNTWFDCSAHRIHCESVMRELPNVAQKHRRFKSDYKDPSRVLSDLYAAFPDRLMWGSDSPFYSWITRKGRLPFKLKSSYRAETDCLLALEDSAIEAIAHQNTLKFLHR